jgi:hypothetical protein
MTTAATPRFARHESQARRLFAGLALVATLVTGAVVGQLADSGYDAALMAQADLVPTQVVVVTAKRLPRA